MDPLAGCGPTRLNTGTMAGIFRERLSLFNGGGGNRRAHDTSRTATDTIQTSSARDPTIALEAHADRGGHIANIAHRTLAAPWPDYSTPKEIENNAEVRIKHGFWSKCSFHSHCD
jgi:hypothetical protein